MTNATIEINGHKVSMATLAAAPLTAHQLGALDAQEHKAFAPEMYFGRMADRVDYAYGFHSVNHSLIAADYLEAAYLAQMEREEADQAHYDECRNMGRPGGL